MNNYPPYITQTSSTYHNIAGNPMDYLLYKIILILSYYSNSTKPNQFCLEIFLCRIRGAFDYLLCPYYPAYIG